MRRAAVVWAVAAAVLVPGPASSAPTMEAVAVWQQRSPSGDWDVWSATMGRPSPGSPAGELRWSAPEPVAELAGADENPAVAVDAGGAALAVWQHAAGGGTDVWWSRRGPAGWGAAAPLSELAGDDVDPAVALDGAGGGLAVWVNRSLPAVVWSRFDGQRWSEPQPLPGSFTDPSLPELTFLDGPGPAALVAYVDLLADPQPVYRTHFARFDGSSWTPGAPVPLEADQREAMPSHAHADYAKGAFQRLAVVPEVGGGAQVLWGGPVGEGVLERFSSPGVQGARLSPEGSWSALRSPSGRAQVGGTGCSSPAAAATGSRDAVAVFMSTGTYESARATRGAYRFQGSAYRSGYDDVRPAVAPLADAVVVMGTGLPFFGEDPPRPSAITWALGTLRPPTDSSPPSLTFGEAQVLPLATDARYPAVASTLGGTQNPLRISLRSRAFGAGLGGGPAIADTGPAQGGGTEEAEAAPTVAAGPLWLRGVHARSERGDDSSSVVVRVAEVRLATDPPLVAEGLEVRASASCPDGRSGGTVLARLAVGSGPPMEVPARQNTSIPLGAFTVKVNEVVLTPRSAVVRGLRVVGPGVDVVVGYAEAAVDGCTGSGPPAGAPPGHEH